MKTYKLVLFLSLLMCSYNVISQNNDWSPSTITQLGAKITKVNGSITYFIDPQSSASERKSIIETTKKYIEHNLELIGESDFKDSVYIVLARDKDEMIKYAGGRISGISMLKDQYVPQNMICCIPKVLKHELMHMIVSLKWNPLIKNYIGHPDWLAEGLAVYADPEAEDLKGFTLEEIYTKFYQSNKLLPDLLTKFPSVTSSEIKIAYIQSGYIVQFLIERYGVQKFKELWFENSDFERIYGIDLECMVQKINNELDQRYCSSIK
ncbi:peptidase MA family metallohydrolase [Dysgonomonas reticulitermitis]